MPQKTIQTQDLGTVIIARRRGTNHIRLSFNSRGQVRLSLPYYVPTSVGLAFMRSKKTWLEAQKEKSNHFAIKNNAIIGKNARLILDEENPALTTKTRLVDARLEVKNYNSQDESSRQIVEQAIYRSLRKQSEDLLLPRISELARKHKYNYRSTKIKLLRSRWGSCSSKKDIAISLFLIQLPWELIDYVLLHELVHTEHMHHGPAFWQQMEADLPGTKIYKKRLKKYRPSIIGY